MIWPRAEAADSLDRVSQADGHHASKHLGRLHLIDGGRANYVLRMSGETGSLLPVRVNAFEFLVERRPSMRAVRVSALVVVWSAEWISGSHFGDRFVA